MPKQVVERKLDAAQKELKTEQSKPKETRDKEK
jgi:hypothetical protein